MSSPAPPTKISEHSLVAAAVIIAIAFSILAFIDPQLLTGKAVDTAEVSDLMMHHVFVDN